MILRTPNKIPKRKITSRAADWSLQDSDDITTKPLASRIKSEPRRRRRFFSRDTKEYPYASLQLLVTRKDFPWQSNNTQQEWRWPDTYHDDGIRTIIKHALLSLHSCFIHALRKERHWAPSPDWTDLIGDQTDHVEVRTLLILSDSRASSKNWHFSTSPSQILMFTDN